MKIAIVINSKHAVIKNTGLGVQNFTYQLIESLSKRNHEVTLFASGDSQVFCNLIYLNKNSLALDESIPKDFYSYYEDALFIKAIEMANNGQYDLIHSQDHSRGLLFSHLSKKPIVSTFHDVYDNNRSPFDLVKKFNLENDNHTLITVSNYQRKILEDHGFVNVKTIYNGIDTLSIPAETQQDKKDMIFLGRLNQRKGVSEAVQASLILKKNLKIYAYVNDLLEEEVKLKESIIKMIGDNSFIQLNDPVFGQEKWKTFSQAKLFLFPVQWEDPCPLTVLESMACGTPLVAFAKGSLTETVIDGETGFLVNSSDEDRRGDWIVKKTGMEGLCEAVQKIYAMAPEDYEKMRFACRKHIEENFTAERMIENYEKVYKKILGV